MSEVKQGQSFLDKVTELTGSYENAIEMAILNGVSITDNAIVKTKYLVGEITEKNVVSYFESHSEPATDIDRAYQLELDNLDLGIGKMKIGTTFIVG